MSALRRFFKATLGQDVIEYALLCSLLALAGAGLAASFGNDIGNAFNNINAKNEKAHGQVAPGQDNSDGDHGNGKGNGGDGNNKGIGNQKH